MAIADEIKTAARDYAGREATPEDLAAASSLSVGQLQDYFGGGGSGGSAPDISGVPSTLDYAQNLAGTEEQALNQLVLTQRAQDKPIDIYNQQNEAAGVPQLTASSRSLSKEIASIEDQLDQVEPGVAGRTRESMVTEAMRQRLVSYEKEPLQKNLAKLGTALGRIGESLNLARADVAQRVALILSGQDREMEVLKYKFAALQSRNAYLLSGFSQDKQVQLDQIYASWQRGNELDDRQWALANQLAQGEQEYFRSLQTTAAQLGVAVDGSEDSSTLLNLIGTTQAAQIAFENEQERKKGGESGAINIGTGGTTGGGGAAPTEPKPTKPPVFSLSELWDLTDTEDGSATLK